MQCLSTGVAWWGIRVNISYGDDVTLKQFTYLHTNFSGYSGVHIISGAVINTKDSVPNTDDSATFTDDFEHDMPFPKHYDIYDWPLSDSKCGVGSSCAPRYAHNCSGMGSRLIVT